MGRGGRRGEEEGGTRRTKDGEEGGIRRKEGRVGRRNEKSEKMKLKKIKMKKSLDLVKRNEM